MTFGWAIGLPTNQVLFQCHGPAYGSPSSFRAEAYGMLSTILFLKALQEVFQVDVANSPIQLTCDNQSLLDYIAQRRQYASCYPNSTLSPEWDVTEQIATELTMLDPTMSFALQWVKGHQDRSTTGSTRLCPAARLNIHADRLANTYPDRRPRKTVPMLPAARCLLIHPTCTITSRVSRSLFRLSAQDELRQFCLDKFQWTRQVFDNIAWPALRQFNRKSQRSFQSRTKVIFNLLPTKRHCVKFKSWIDDKCTYCEKAPETIHHLMFCASNPSAAQCRTSMARSIIGSAKTAGLPEDLLCLLDIIINQLVESGNVLAPDDFPQSATQAIQHQTALGWDKFFQGFISAKWDSAFPIPRDPDQQLKRITSFLVEHALSAVFQLWDLHLEHVHQTATSAQSLTVRLEVIAQAEALFSRLPHVLPEDRTRLFPEDPDEFLRRSTTPAIQQYIDRYSPLILDSHVAHQKALHVVFQPTGA